MPSTAGQDTELKTLGLAIESEWTLGPRTPAWEELWRRILEDFFQQRQEEPCSERMREMQIDG
jgi:hypothetical protein